MSEDFHIIDSAKSAIGHNAVVGEFINKESKSTYINIIFGNYQCNKEILRLDKLDLNIKVVWENESVLAVNIPKSINYTLSKHQQAFTCGNQSIQVKINN